MACIHDKAAKLSSSDTKELLQIYAAKLDEGLTDKQATRAAVRSMASDTLTERKELSEAAAEFGGNIKPRSLVFAKPIKETPKIESSKDILNRDNIVSVLNRIRNIDISLLPTDKLKTLRKKLVNLLEVISLKAKDKISDSLLNNINTGLVQLATGIKAINPKDTSVRNIVGKEQVGTITQEQTTGNLAEDVLIDGFTYNSALKQDKSETNDGSRNTLSTFLESDSDPKKNNILTTVHNLFSRIAGTEVQNALPVLNENQTTALDTLVKFNKVFTDKVINKLEYFNKTKIFKNNLDGSFNKNQPQFNDKGDPFGYLLQVDKDGKRFLNENIFIAMSMVGYNWVATQGRKTLFNDREAINKIVGNKPEDVPVADAKTLLTYVGVPRNVLVESLGSQVYSLLGLKGKDNIDGDFETRLKMAIGEVVITGLLESDVLTQNSLTSEQMQDISSLDTLSVNTESTTNFVQIKNITDPENNNFLAPDETVQGMIDTIKDSDKVLSELFDISSFDTAPSFTPIKTVPQTLKGNFMKVPSKMKSRIKKLQDIKWGVKIGITSVVQFLGKDNLLEIEGYKSNEFIESKHINERPGIIAKNESILRSLDHATDFINNMPEVTAPFYFKMVAWANSRIGIDSNTVNPAANTMHRHMFGIKSHNITIKDNKQRDYFKLAVALAFSHSIDKSTLDNSINRFEEILNNELVQKGIVAVKAIKNKNLSKEQKTQYQKDIVAATEFGKGGIHTLDGLVALSAYNPSKSFKTNLGIETDGITNGVIIGLIQSMLEPDMAEALAAGGMFTNTKDTDYSSWISGSNQNNDSYQRLAKLWNAHLVQAGLGVSEDNKSATNTGFLKNIFDPLVEISDKGEITVTEEGRSISKNPLMTTNYGAGIKRILVLLEEKALTNLYNKMIDIATDNPNAQIELDSFINDFNNLLGTNINTPDISTLKTLVLDKTTELAFRKEISETYGVTLDLALNQQFEGFNEFRITVNDAFKTMFYAFNARYKKELAQAVKNKDGVALTQKEKSDIVENLVELVPSIKTALSEGVDDSILVMKQEKTRDYSDNTQQIQQKYTGGVKNTEHVIGRNKGKEINSATGTISQTILKDGGVSGLILAIQSIDSNIISEVYESFDILNIFDAGYYSINDVVEGTQKYNEAFLKMNKAYSIIEEVETSLKRILSESVKDQVLYKEVIKDISGDRSLGKLNTPRDVFNKVRDLRKRVQSERKRMFEGKDKIVNSSQASIPDGYYTEETQKVTLNQQEKEIKALLDEAYKDILKSSPNEIDFDNFNATYQANLTGDNSKQIFDDLDTYGSVKETTEHKAVLKGLLDSLINKVISPLDTKPLKYDVKVNQDGNIVYGATKGSQVRIQAGNGVIGNNNQISAQETLVHEMIHVISKYGVDNNFPGRIQLQKLYEQVKANIKIEDFLPRDSNGNIVSAVDAKAEYAAAKERYNYIFKNQEGNNLHEFLAFGLTNDIFNKALSNIASVGKVDLKSGSIKERLENLYQAILNWVSGKIYKTENLSADKALLKLTEELVGINDKNRNYIFKILDSVTALNPKITGALDKIIFKPLTNYYDQLRNTPNKGKFGRTAEVVLGIPILAKEAAFSETVAQIARAINFTEKSMIVKMARELTGVTTTNFAWHDLLRFSKKYIDSARKHLSDNVISDIREHFVDNFTKEEAVAFNKILLKSDFSALMQSYDIKEIVSMLKDPTKLNSVIETTRNTLIKDYGDNGNYYVRQANSLGSIMSTGKALEENPMLNAYNIATLNYVPNKDVTGDINKAEQLISNLASLYSFKYNNSSTKNTAVELIEKEYARDSKINGVILTLNTHNGFKEKALDQLFNNEKHAVVKGYTQELFNPDIDIKIGTRADKETMATAGYYPQNAELNTIPRDKDDPNVNEAVLYISKTKPANAYVKTITSLTSRTAKGHSLLDSYKDARDVMSHTDALIAMHNIKAKKAKAVDKQFDSPITTKSNNENILVPIINAKNEIVDYRYLMTEHIKDTILEKDNRFDVILGKMEGSIIDKVNTNDINKKSLELAYKDFKDDFGKNPSKFVRIASNSADQRYKEIYQMMPTDMKNEMSKIWGSDEIFVKEELIDLIFGYRKLSFTDAKFIKKITNYEPFKFLKLDMHLKLSGQIWQEVVGVVKNNIVIKTGVVLKDNIVSNNFLLWVKGVPSKDILKNQSIALIALDAYQKELNKRDKLQRKLDNFKNLSNTERKAIQNQVITLTDNLKNNPVSELIDEGIFQTIVEDLNLEEDDFTFKKKLIDKVSDKTEKYIPKTATEVYKQAYLSKDTFIYKQLLKGTQYSDFVARYTLFEHLTKNKKVAKDVAIVEILETFINYDVPTSPALQYANDMGIIMFTKFLLRIQRVIFKIIKTNPANVLALHSLQVAFGETSDILDSNLLTTSLIGRIQNPLIDIPEGAAYLGGYEFAKSTVDIFD